MPRIPPQLRRAPFSFFVSIIVVLFLAGAFSSWTARTVSAQPETRGAQPESRGSDPELIPLDEPPEAAGDPEALVPPASAALDDGELVGAQGEAAVADAPLSKGEIAAALRQIAAEKRDEVVGATSERVTSKQLDRLGQILFVVFLCSLGGVLLFAAPLVIRRRLARQRAQAQVYGAPPPTGAWKYSALAALLFFVAVNVFGLVFAIMRGSQILLGSLTNPQIHIASATFELITEKADELAEAGPVLLEPITSALTGASDSPILSVVVTNVRDLTGDVSVFGTIAGWFSGLDWLFGLVPMVLALVVLALFARGVAPVFRDIITLPARATAGHARLGRKLVRKMLGAVGAELAATGALVAVMMALSLLASFFLVRLLVPAIEIFFAYLLLSFTYVQSTSSASSFWIFLSLTASLLFLVLNVLTIVAGSTLFLGRVHKIFINRFRLGVALRTNRVFFTRGLLCTAWLFVLPLLYVLLALEAIEWIVSATVETESWPLILGLGPVLFVAGFVTAFWAGRGTRALRWLATYKPLLTAATPGPPPVVNHPATRVEVERPRTMHVQTQPAWPVSTQTQPASDVMAPVESQPVMVPPAHPPMPRRPRASTAPPPLPYRASSPELVPGSPEPRYPSAPAGFDPHDPYKSFREPE